jgi:hypothetical protein
MDRAICNIIIGECSENVMSKPYLVKTCELNKTNSESLKYFVLEILEEIMSVKEYDNFKLLATDAASYCIKLGADLKCIFSELRHITCLAHAVRRIAEYIRSESPITDKIIATMKKYLTKNKDNQRIYEEFCKVKIPKLPIIRDGVHGSNMHLQFQKIIMV